MQLAGANCTVGCTSNGEMEAVVPLLKFVVMRRRIIRPLEKYLDEKKDINYNRLFPNRGIFCMALQAELITHFRPKAEGLNVYVKGENRNSIYL